MITIQFSNIQDFHDIYKRLCEQIEHASDKSFLEITIKRSKGNRLLIGSSQTPASFHTIVQPLLAHVFTTYIIHTYEKQWIEDLLENKFCYTDAEEKNTIVSIACSIMDGEKLDLPQIEQMPSRQNLLEEAMLALLQEGTEGLSFSFDSFVQFRLKAYRECLATYVEMAIDEYKLEQDYQNLIENLRAFVARKNPVVEKVFVVYDKKPTFYDDDFLPIHDDVIQTAVKSIGNTLIEPSLLQPLLALAPNKIDLYTNAEESGILYTLKNIFQERLTIYPLALFADFPQFHSPATKKKS